MIHEFYANEEIFVTGGSGAVGKALIEKLLRSCEVSKVYLLLRPKKNLSIEKRLEKLKNDKLLKVLRATKPYMLDRLIPIPGDSALPNLGISPENIALMENVSIIFHCAANVRFDASLREVFNLNVEGTHKALLIAEKFKKLKIFLHVSTFYSNPYLKYVEPKLYESPMDWRTLQKMLKDDKEQENIIILTRKLTIGFPNTYTFTKNLAETVVSEFKDRIPVAIFRPSIVLHAISDPMPGYPPTMMGAMGIFLLVGAGILKTVFMSEQTRLDITPQDYAIKTMLYYAYRAESEYREKIAIESVPVYMPSSSQVIPYTFYHLCQMTDKGLLYKFAFEKNLMYPSCHYTDNRFVYKFLVFTKEILPALLVDGLLVLFGRKPAIMGIVRKAYVSREFMKAFVFNTYDSPGITHFDDLIKTTKDTELDLSRDIYIGQTDKGLQLCSTMVSGIREYLLNEDPKTIPIAQKRMQIKLWVNYLLRAVLAYYILSWFYGYIMSIF